jgi:cellulose biosynthesis protein BcsQ
MSLTIEESIRLLPHDALEGDVEKTFSPALLQALGFGPEETKSQYKIGRQTVDWAALRNRQGKKIFALSPEEPCLYLEAKSRKQCLELNHPHYVEHLNQLRSYLQHEKSSSVQWGILTNSIHAQLFLKHGKVVYPATPCLEVGQTGEAVVTAFRKRMKEKEQTRALCCAIYSNKGGVGKTSTTINLAATLSLKDKRVLVIDLDPNQGDLSKSLGIPFPEEGLSLLLTNKKDIKECIVSYKYEKPRSEKINFDVIPTDLVLYSIGKKEAQLNIKFRPTVLMKAIEKVRAEYDYIFIDAPPGAGDYPKLALCAADVVLLPASPTNINSLENAATAITTYLPNTRQYLEKSGCPGPIPLGILGNNYVKKESPKLRQFSEKAILNIVEEKRKSHGIGIEHYFWPHCEHGGSRRRQMSGIEASAYIPQSQFEKIPAILMHSSVRNQFEEIVKEFFL